MAYVGKITGTNGTTGLVGSTLYGTCSTAAGTAAKTVTLAEFDTLITGVTVHVKMTNPNTATNPTLNVNSTGAKPICRNGTTKVGNTEGTSWVAGAMLSFTYDGTNWVMNDSCSFPLAHTHPDQDIKWGTVNLTGSYNFLDGLMNQFLSPNRFAGAKAAGITIEYSNDAGSTWTTYPNLTDVQKSNLFTNRSNSVRIGGPTSATPTVSANSQLRITVNTGTAQIYTTISKMHIYVSTNYSQNCKVTIKAATHGDPTNFSKTICNNHPISGWSGWNVVAGSFTTYGNTDAQYQYIQFTFTHTGTTEGKETAGLLVTSIMGFGGVGWTCPSQLAQSGHVYAFDGLMCTTFPNTMTISSGGLTVSSGGITVNGGVIKVLGNQYQDSYSGALNMNNSDIYGLNSIYTADASEDAAEGFHFYRDTTHVDTFRIASGKMYFYANRTLGQKPNPSGVILHTGNTTVTQTLSSGTKIGTITLDGTSTDLYCQTNTNTDTKVTQTATSTSDFRPIVLGYTHSTTPGDLAPSTAPTDQVYVTSKLYMKPTTGDLYTDGTITITTSGCGLKLTDSDGNAYAAIWDNGYNLWIGAGQAETAHHVGQTFISAGYDSTNNIGYGTIRISVPNATNDGATNYYALHDGNTSASASIASTATGAYQIGTVTIRNTTTTFYGVNTNTWTAMVGATSSANGTAGYVGVNPPKDGYNTKFWRADGSWAVPTNTTYGLSGAYAGTGNSTWVTTLTAGGSGTTSTVPTASTTAYGITKLSTATDSTSTALAATASAVKAAYDLANGKSVVTASTSTVSGATTIKSIKINNTNYNIYDSGNTDEKVKQTATSTSDFRPVVFGTTHSTTPGDLAPSTAPVDQVYVTPSFYMQPSTGKLYAKSKIYFDNATFDTSTTPATVTTEAAGLYAYDETGYRYQLIIENTHNLWIGAGQTTGQHHTGETYISAGYDKANSVGFSTIKISVPNATNDGATNYSVWHSGNLTPYTHPTYTAQSTAAIYAITRDATGHIGSIATPSAAQVSTIINQLSEGTSNPQLADYYVAQYAGGGSTTKTYHRRPISALWNTLRALITATTTGSGNAITSVSLGNDGNNLKFTFTKGTTFSTTDENVKQTATSTSANYEVLFSSTADNTTRTEGARKNSNLTFNPSTGTLSATVFSENGTTLANKYAAKTHSHNYAGSASDGGPATQVTSTIATPTNAADFSIPFHSGVSTGGKDLYHNDGISYQTRIGTSSQLGWAVLSLGNNIASSGDADAKRGYLRLYSGGAYYTQLQSTSLTVDRVIDIPDMDGAFLVMNKDSTSYWGIHDGDGGTTGWIRTTENGFIPSTNKTLAEGGQSSLGTASYAFQNAYVANVHLNQILMHEGSYTGTINQNTLTANRTWTFPKHTSGIIHIEQRANFYDDTTGVASTPWQKVASLTTGAASTDRTATFIVAANYSGDVDKKFGIVQCHLRTNGSKVFSSAELTWLYKSPQLFLSDIVLLYKSVANTNTTIEIWAKSIRRYSGYTFTLLDEHDRKGVISGQWELTTNNGAAGSASLPTGFTSKNSRILSDGTLLATETYSGSDNTHTITNTDYDWDSFSLILLHIKTGTTSGLGDNYITIPIPWKDFNDYFDSQTTYNNNGYIPYGLSQYSSGIFLMGHYHQGLTIAIGTGSWVSTKTIKVIGIV